MIQNQAIKVDQALRTLLCNFNAKELFNNSKYKKLVRLYKPLESILPKPYLDTVGGKIYFTSGLGRLPPFTRCPSSFIISKNKNSGVSNKRTGIPSWPGPFINFWPIGPAVLSY